MEKKKHYRRQRKREHDKCSDMQKNPEGKKKKGSLLSNIILVIALCVFVFSAVQLIRSILPYLQAKQEYDGIKDLVITEDENTDSEEDVSHDNPEDDSFSVDFKALLELNPDTVGWIRFDEPSIINYPVVQGADNDIYLKKSFQANDNHLGAIFMAAESKSDFSDRNTMIYGHNVKIGGEMFSQLKKYQEESFYKQYPYFYIYTPDGKKHTYQIFSAGIIKEDADNYILTYRSDEEYENYLNLAKSSSLYDTGAAVDVHSKIVSLSTCTNVRADERFLVQGVLLEEK